MGPNRIPYLTKIKLLILIGYVIEKRSSKSTKWTKSVTLDTYCLQYCVDNLKEKSECQFRVLAENAIGLSAPAVTDNIVLKTHASKDFCFLFHYFVMLNRTIFSRSIATDGSAGDSIGQPQCQHIGMGLARIGRRCTVGRIYDSHSRHQENDVD